MDKPRTPYLYFAASAIVLLTLAAAAALTQSFLLPLESYWPALAAGLTVYACIDALLIIRRVTVNLFEALDGSPVHLRDVAWPAVGPAVISLALAIVTRLPFDRLLPVMLILCLLQTAFTSATVSAWNAGRTITGCWNIGWIASLVIVTAAYTLAFFSLKTYSAVNPLLEGPRESRGIWYTVPVAKSETYPFGLARLEDGIIDDLGRPFMAALGQSLGLVERCAIPGSDIRSFAQISPDPNVQPKFRTNVDTLCPEWIQTLPGYFWRIGLISLFLLSLVTGAVVVRHPVDFAALSLLMLFGWFVWPPSERVRMGNVPMLIIGMPWLALLFSVIRRGRSAPVVLWGLFAGLIFGLAGLFRQPVGFALTVTALVGLAWAAWKQKNLYLPLLALLALLAGRAMPTAMMNELFQYRDEKLQITAPVTSTREHGVGFALLGGIGSKNLSTDNFGAPVYENSLDIAFADVPIWLTMYNENPLINLTPQSYGLVLEIGGNLFWRYTASHPAEFLWILCRKAGEYLQYLGLPLLGLLLFVTLVMGRYAKFDPASHMGVSVDGARETAGLFLVLAIVSSIPAVLTTITYGENLFLPAVVIFFTGIPALFITFKSILLKKRTQS